MRQSGCRSSGFAGGASHWDYLDDRWCDVGEFHGQNCGAKKNRGRPLSFFVRASQASRPGFRLAPWVVSLHPRWVANCYRCRLSATLSYLSTLPPDSPPLPSAVGHASVPVGIGNITNLTAVVNLFLKKIKKIFWSLKKGRRIAPLAWRR
jgi:hypothetical protein